MHPCAQAETHLRDKRERTWLLNTERQVPVGKSQRRTTLRGPACTEASKVLFPLKASADTCGKRQVQGSRGELGPGVHLGCMDSAAVGLCTELRSPYPCVQ